MLSESALAIIITIALGGIMVSLGLAVLLIGLKHALFGF